jgi:aminopeptidase N
MPSPARAVQAVAENAAAAVDFFSSNFGPYPFTDLKITQMPGRASQGWPGMIFLSTYAFLSDSEKAQIHLTPVERTMTTMTIAHETAHQWWGDVVSWNGYRDQWLIEALANYSAMLLLRKQDPAQFRAVLDKYRDDLFIKQESGDPLMDAGPVTLGIRLSSSKFPAGYEAISYGRGTWLFFMLDSMIKDGESLNGHRPGATQTDDLFIKTLHNIRDTYAGKTITTKDVLAAFEPSLPASLRYEGHDSLDWFYDSWVNGKAIPHFELIKVKFGEVKGKSVVSGTIVVKQAPDDLVTLVPVYALLPRKKLVGQVFADEHEVQFRLAVPPGTQKIGLDPEHTLLTTP